jgi:hypothetical protein
VKQDSSGAANDIRDDIRPPPSVFASLRRDRAEAKGEGGQERENHSPRFEPDDMPGIVRLTANDTESVTAMRIEKLSAT